MCYQETWLYACGDTKRVMDRITCNTHDKTHGDQCEGFIGYIETVKGRCWACEMGKMLPKTKRGNESADLDLCASKKWVWSERENDGQLKVGWSG